MYFHRTFISANRPAETATDTQQRLQASVALYIILHKQVLPVEYGISELRNPITQNQDTARTGKHQVQLDVTMAENEIVDFGMGFQVFLGKTDEILLVLAQIRGVAAFHTMLQAAVRRPRQTEIHSPSGMDAGKHALAKAVAEHGTQETELAVGVAQTVAVRQHEHLVAHLHRHRLGVQRHAAFLHQVIAAPDVVVARKEVHLHAPVGQFAELPEKTCVATGHHRLVFIPKIKDVSQQVDRRSLILDTV